MREVDRPLLVLGSTQPASVVDHERASDLGVTVVQRRSGGGAVLVSPGAQIWVDLWVPSGDRLWKPEPRRQAGQAGEWWADALSAAGASGLEVHRGASVPASVPAPGDELICFAGLGPGEVHASGRKVVGLAQWRSRQGALVHCCVYHRWDPGMIVALLQLDEERRTEIGAALLNRAIGLDGVRAGSFRVEGLLEVLPDDAPWDVVEE